MTDYAAIYTGMREGNDKYGGGKVRGLEIVIGLVKRTNPRNILDYGSGQGYQYLASRVHEQWGGLLPYCYDVGVRQLAERPAGLFDGIICSDMMEHIDDPDIDGVLSDIFGLSSVREPPEQSFVYFHISTVPSKRLLPGGRNSHLTVQAPSWWCARLAKFERPGLMIEARFRPDVEPIADITKDVEITDEADLDRYFGETIRQMAEDDA